MLVVDVAADGQNCELAVCDDDDDDEQETRAGGGETERMDSGLGSKYLWCRHRANPIVTLP